MVRQLNAALELHEAGRVSEAVLAYQLVLREEPQQAAPAYSNIGMVLAGMGRVANRRLHIATRSFLRRLFFRSPVDPRRVHAPRFPMPRTPHAVPRPNKRDPDPMRAVPPPPWQTLFRP